MAVWGVLKKVLDKLEEIRAAFAAKSFSRFVGHVDGIINQQYQDQAEMTLITVNNVVTNGGYVFIIFSIDQNAVPDVAGDKASANYKLYIDDAFQTNIQHRGGCKSGSDDCTVVLHYCGLLTAATHHIDIGFSCSDKVTPYYYSIDVLEFPA